MTKFESQVKHIQAPQEAVYTKLSDLNNLQQLMDLVPPGKLRIGADAFHHSHIVRYSDLDVNRHLNNVRIAALASDALDPGANEFVNTLQINYTAETPPGAVLSLSAAREGAAFAVRGEAEGRVRFEAAGTLAPL